MIPTDLLAAEYLAGASYRKLGMRHGLAPTTIYKRLRSLVDDGRRPDFMETRQANWQTRVEEIAGIVSKAFELRPGRIWNETRQADAVRARYAVFLLADEADLPQAASAKAFEMERSTVSYGLSRARYMAEKDKAFIQGLDVARRNFMGEQA